MMTQEERRAAFVLDIKEVLKKHNAELTVEDKNVRSYYPEDFEIEATLNSEYDDEGECVKPYTEVYFGRYLDGNE